MSTEWSDYDYAEIHAQRTALLAEYGPELDEEEDFAEALAAEMEAEYGSEDALREYYDES